MTSDYGPTQPFDANRSPTGGPSYGAQTSPPLPAAPGRPSGAGRPASMGRRFAARLLDGLIFAVLFAFVLGGVISEMAEEVDRTGEVSGASIAGLYGGLALIALLGLLYEVGLIAVRGQTLGKLAVGIKVVRERGGAAPGWSSSALRWLVPTAGSFVCGIGQFVVYASPLFDSTGHRQGWHDKVAKTLVVTAR